MKNLFIIIQILIIITLKLLIILKTELTEDEAYYYTWAKKISLSYFDHPPFVAYVIKIGTSILGENELGVRIPALVLSLLFLIIIIFIFKEIDSSKILIALYIFSLTLIFAVGAIIITPDTPMAFFILLTFFFLLKSYKNERWLYFSSITYGLSLLSKYISILFLPSIILFFFERKKLFSKKFVIFLLISLLIFSPCIIWNIQNDFISFKFQLLHGYGKKELKFLNIILYLVDSLLVLSFPLSILIYFYAFKGIIKEKINLLTFSFLFPFTFFMISSLKTKAEANWPLVSYIFLLILAIKHLKENKIFYILSSITFIMMTIIHLHTITPIIKFKKDPTNRLRSWEKLANDVEWFAERYGINKFSANTYQIASILSFYLKDKPYVYSLNINSRENQFTIWQKNKKLPDTLFYVGKVNENFYKIFKEIKKVGVSKSELREFEFYILLK
ncbi:MAG: glycosyltransferase family 39 protein [Candidatus Hydrothermales bacterium]